MKKIRKVLSVLLAAALLCAVFVFPGGAETPADEKYGRLMMYRYGYRLDRVEADMRTSDAAAYSFADDPQVADIDVTYSLTYTKEETWLATVYLKTFTSEELNAFIDRYSGAPDVIHLSPTGYITADEDKFAVLVRLRTETDLGEPLPPMDFTPADFDADTVKKVHPEFPLQLSYTVRHCRLRYEQLSCCACVIFHICENQKGPQSFQIHTAIPFFIIR